MAYSIENGAFLRSHSPSDPGFGQKYFSARFGPDKSESGRAGAGDWAHGGFKAYRGHAVELGAIQDIFGLIILELHRLLHFII